MLHLYVPQRGRYGNLNRGEKQVIGLRTGFTPLGMWAFSVGTSIGWGSFIVTCNTYLQKSGLLGTIFGLLLGMAVIFVITWNLQYMIRKAPGAGGIVIACGMAKYEGGECVADVFNQADRLMYKNKNLLKSKGAGAP